MIPNANHSSVIGNCLLDRFLCDGSNIPVSTMQNPTHNELDEHRRDVHVSVVRSGASLTKCSVATRQATSKQATAKQAACNRGGRFGNCGEVLESQRTETEIAILNPALIAPIAYPIGFGCSCDHYGVGLLSSIALRDR